MYRKQVRAIILIYTEISNDGDYLKQIKKEQEKKTIVAKVNYKNSNNTQVNNECKVQNIMKDIKNSQKIEDVVNNDMTNQEKSLKERLEQRKNKKLLSTSDCTEAIETVVSHIQIIYFRKTKEKQKRI